MRAHFLGENVFGENYYVNCFEDILIEVWLDKKIAFDIDVVYQNTSLSDQEAKLKVDLILERRNLKNKMRISRNAEKVEKIRKIFRKYFVGV